MRPAEIVRPFSIGVGLLVIIFAGYSSAIRLSEAAAGLTTISTAGGLVLLKTIAALEILLPTAFYLSVLSAIGRLQSLPEWLLSSADGPRRAQPR